MALPALGAKLVLRRLVVAATLAVWVGSQVQVLVKLEMVVTAVTVVLVV